MITLMTCQELKEEFALAGDRQEFLSWLNEMLLASMFEEELRLSHVSGFVSWKTNEDFEPCVLWLKKRLEDNNYSVELTPGLLIISGWT